MAVHGDLVVTLSNQVPVMGGIEITISNQETPEEIVSAGSGKLAEYTHYLTIGSTVTEVFPLNFLASSLIDTREKDDHAFYRRKFSGTLAFVNNNGADDFDLLYATELVSPDDKILYEVKRNAVTYWEGYFSTTDGTFDLDRCVFEVTPLPDDDYGYLFETADIGYNILNLPLVTTRALQGIYDVTYTRNHWLIDIIEYLADQIKTGVTVSSDFFSAAINPVTLSDSTTTLLTLAQKSDILRPTSSNPATTALMSWNELMNILWVMFQVQWDYDSATDTINVEHISWFTVSSGLDLRTQQLSQGSNKYSYLKEKMPKYEKFSFMEAGNDNFIGWPIWYDSRSVDQNPDTNTFEQSINVTTDLDYIIKNSVASASETNAISDEGFVMLCNYESGGDYYVKLALGEFHPDVRLNMDLSVANLQNYYYRHNRVLIEGYLNGVLTTFWTARKTKQQIIYAIVCSPSTYDPSEEITTELGESYLGVKARVQQSELKPSGEMKFMLLYGPEDNTPTPITAEKFILITEDGCGHFTAVLSEGADAELTINIKHVIFESDQVTTHCSDAVGQDWVIHAAETGSTFDLTLCDAIPSGGCIYYNSITYDFTNWTVSWILDTACKCT